MAPRPERVLAIDVEPSIVRGIVLTGGPRAIAGGYAQLGFRPEVGPAAVAGRIAAALDVKATLPVVVTCHQALPDGVAAEVIEQVRSHGFVQVEATSRESATRRASPNGGEPEVLVDSDIADGLLASHAGLTLGTLAPVVGAALGLLGLGAPIADDEGPVAVWHPEAPEPVAEDVDLAVAPTPDGAEDVDLAASSTPVVAEDVDDTIRRLGGDFEPGAPGRPLAPGLTVAPPVRDDHLGFAASGAELAGAGDDDVTHDGVVGMAAAAADVGGDDDVTSRGGVGGTVVASQLPHRDEREPRPETELHAAPVPATTVSGPARSGPDAATIASATAATGRPIKPLLMLLTALVGAVVLGLVISQCVGSDAGDEVRTDAGSPESSAAGADTAGSAGPSTQVAADADTAGAADTGTQTGDAGEAESSAPATTTTEDAESGEAAAVAGADGRDEIADQDAADNSQSATEAEPTVDPLAGLPPLSSLPERGAVFRPPTLYLEGPVQTHEQADQLYQRAIEVVGPDNVVNRYVVRPDAPPATNGNVRVEQAVLFESGSAVIADEFVPTLELGVAVMTLNPHVTMIVQGHTDSVGSEASNRVLSERRAEAVVDYLARRGVPRERLQSVGFGESQPIAANDTAEGRQINRRIEVVLLDLLAPQ